MKSYIIHKTDITPEDNFFVFSNITAILLAVKSEQYIAFAPIILLISIKLVLNIFMFFKWKFSYAIKLDQDHIILNHTILYNKVKVPLVAINCLNKEKQFVELKNNSGVKLPRLNSNNRIFFSTLSDNERKELFDRMENFGIIVM
jgi:hypothetical protein